MLKVLQDITDSKNVANEFELLIRVFVLELLGCMRHSLLYHMLQNLLVNSILLFSCTSGCVCVRVAVVVGLVGGWVCDLLRVKEWAAFDVRVKFL